MRLSFVGVYLNGLKHGFGIEYYQNGRLEYKGNFLNGKDMVLVKNMTLVEKLNIKENLLMEKEEKIAKFFNFYFKILI